MFESDVDLIHVQQLINKCFDLDGIRELCFDLHIDYEAFPGDTSPAKSRELVKYCYREGRIADLVQHAAVLRPEEKTWSQPAKPYTRDELPAEWVEPLQQLYRLVKEFNRVRSQPFSAARTRAGDEIAFRMREAAPFLFGQVDVDSWLASESIGKRLAAVKYLDWLQDVDYVGRLLGMLVTDKPFVQLHVLLALDSMVDQLDAGGRRGVTAALTAYRLAARDPDRDFWRQRILARLRGEVEEG